MRVLCDERADQHCLIVTLLNGMDEAMGPTRIFKECELMLEIAGPDSVSEMMCQLFPSENL
jgi:hypothetical protein